MRERVQAFLDRVRHRVPGLALALGATWLVAVAVSWPLVLHVVPYDGWIVSSPDAHGSEFLGVLGSNQAALECYTRWGAAPLDAFFRPWRTAGAMVACNFPTHLWNTVDVAWFHWPLGHLFGWGTAWNLSTFLYVWGNALGAWSLTRALGSGRWGALAAALVFASSAPVWMAITQGRTMNAALGTIPLVLAAVVRTVRGDHPVRLAVGAGLSLAWCLYWFWFHAFYLALLAPGLVVLLPDLRARPRRLAALALAGVVALVLVAPSFEAFGQFAEGGGIARHAPAMGEPIVGVPPPGSPALTSDQQTLLFDSLPAFSPLYPTAWWNPIHEVNPAWIAPPWVILALGALAAWRRHLGWFVGAVLALVLSWGPWPVVDTTHQIGMGTGGPVASPVYQWLYVHAPLFPAFRHPDRFLHVTVLAVAIGVAWSVSWLVREDRPAWLRRAGPITAAVAVVGGAWGQAASPAWPNTLSRFEIPPVVDLIAAGTGNVLTLPVPDPTRNAAGSMDLGGGYDTRVTALGALHGRPLTVRTDFKYDRALMDALLKLPEDGITALLADPVGTRTRLRAVGVQTVLLDGSPFGAGSPRWTGLLAQLTQLLGEPEAVVEGDVGFLGAPGGAPLRLAVFDVPAEG